MTKGFSIVVAMDRKRGIGKDGGLPWPKLKGDMKFFRELTTCPDSAAVEKRWGLKPEKSGEERSWDEVSAMLKFAHKLPEISIHQNVVIMGRKTFESLPPAFRPLPDRINCFLSRSEFSVGTPGGQVFGLNPTEALARDESKNAPQVFIIGGGQIFAETLTYSTCAHLYVTEIDAEFPCDTYFPETPGFQPVLSSPWIVEDGIRYRFRRYDRVS